jgi:hypothetical protein
MKHSFFFILLLTVFGICSCKTKQNTTVQNNYYTFHINGSLNIIKSPKDTLKFNIETAETPDESEQGLMYRTEMDDNQAMLFIFPYERVASFWMKNTYLPLDIIFFDKDKKIVHIAKNAVPLSEEPITSKKTSLYALEIKAGLSDKLGIKEGMSMNYTKTNQLTN